MAQFGWVTALLKLPSIATFVPAAIIPLPLVEARPSFHAVSLQEAHNHTSIAPSALAPRAEHASIPLSRHRMIRLRGLPTGDKLVFAHFMVGFTYSYGVGDWQRGKPRCLHYVSQITSIILEIS